MDGTSHLLMFADMSYLGLSLNQNCLPVFWLQIAVPSFGYLTGI